MINRLNEVDDNEKLVEIEIYTEDPEEFDLECDEDISFALTTKNEALEKGPEALMEKDWMVLMKAEEIFPVFKIEDCLKSYFDEPIALRGKWDKFDIECYLADQCESLNMYEDWEERVSNDLDKTLVKEFSDHLNAASDDCVGGLQKDILAALDKGLLERFTKHLNETMKGNAAYSWDEYKDVLFVNNPVIEERYPQGNGSVNNIWRFENGKNG